MQREANKKIPSSTIQIPFSVCTLCNKDKKKKCCKKYKKGKRCKKCPKK